MTQSIKLTTDEMRLMSLFQSITKVTARDCLDDQKYDRIIFVLDLPVFTGSESPAYCIVPALQAPG